MRFDDMPAGQRRVALGALMGGLLSVLGGCAALSEALPEAITAPAAKLSQSVVDAVSPSASTPAASDLTATVTATATTKPRAPAEAQPPVPAAAQLAFDDARRAMRAGRTDDAERAFKALAQSNPELGGAHANLGLMYRNAGKTTEAVAALEQAVRVSPSQAQFHNQLGIAYRHHGQFSKARSAYERAIDLDANYGAAILNLGILHDIYLGEGAKAMPLYERYLALAPGGDPTVTKWVADLKNRKVAANAKAKEKE